MVCAVAAVRIAAIVSAIIWIAGRERPQAIGRQQLPLADFHYTQGLIARQQRIRKAYCENLVGTNRSVSFAIHYVIEAAIGLVPSESSTGDSISRFSITKTGNAHVRHIAVEAAWQYQRRTTTGPTITRRRKDQPQALADIAEKCDLRLNRKFHRMTSRGKRS